MKLDIFKRADILGEPISLTIAGRDTHQTYPGAFLSMVYIGLTCWAAYLIIAEYFDTTSPSVVQTTQESFEYPEISLYDNQLAPTIFLLDNKNRPVPSSEFFKYGVLSAYLVLAESAVVMSRLQINIIPCSQLGVDIKEEAYSYVRKDPILDKYLDNYGHCFNVTKDNFKVYGKPTDDKSQILVWFLTPCSNATGQCKTAPEMFQFKVNVLGPKYSLNVSNKYEPSVPVPAFGASLPLNIAAHQQSTYSLKTTEIQDDSGFLSESVVRKNYADYFHSISTYWDFRDPSQISCDYTSTAPCFPYITAFIQSSGTSVTIQRTYKGIIEAFGDFGGVKEVILLIIISTYSFYHGRSQTKFLFNQIFDMKNKEKDFVELITGKDLNELNKKELKHEKDRLKEAAEQTIDNCLDVVTLVKEISRLKMVLRIMFDKQYETIEPLIIMSMTREEEQEKEESGSKENVKLKGKNAKISGGLEEEKPLKRVINLIKNPPLNPRSSPVQRGFNLSPSKKSPNRIQNQSFQMWKEPLNLDSPSRNIPFLHSIGKEFYSFYIWKLKENWAEKESEEDMKLDTAENKPMVELPMMMKEIVENERNQNDEFTSHHISNKALIFPSDNPQIQVNKESIPEYVASPHFDL